jgi:hypothetical protein
VTADPGRRRPDSAGSDVVRATHEALRSMHSAEELGQRRGKTLRSVISGQPSGREEVPADAR